MKNWQDIMVCKEMYIRHFNREWEDILEEQELEDRETFHCGHLNEIINPNKINSLAWY